MPCSPHGVVAPKKPAAQWSGRFGQLTLKTNMSIMMYKPTCILLAVWLVAVTAPADSLRSSNRTETPVPLRSAARAEARGSVGFCWSS